MNHDHAGFGNHTTDDDVTDDGHRYIKNGPLQGNAHMDEQADGDHRTDQENAKAPAFMLAYLMRTLHSKTFFDDTEIIVSADIEHDQEESEE